VFHIASFVIITSVHWRQGAAGGDGRAAGRGRTPGTAAWRTSWRRPGTPAPGRCPSRPTAGPGAPRRSAGARRTSSRPCSSCTAHDRAPLRRTTRRAADPDHLLIGSTVFFRTKQSHKNFCTKKYFYHKIS